MIARSCSPWSWRFLNALIFLTRHLLWQCGFVDGYNIFDFGRLTCSNFSCSLLSPYPLLRDAMLLGLCSWQRVWNILECKDDGRGRWWLDSPTSLCGEDASVFVVSCGRRLITLKDEHLLWLAFALVNKACCFLQISWCAFQTMWRVDWISRVTTMVLKISENLADNAVGFYW